MGDVGASAGTLMSSGVGGGGVGVSVCACAVSGCLCLFFLLFRFGGGTRGVSGAGLSEDGMVVMDGSISAEAKSFGSTAGLDSAGSESFRSCAEAKSLGSTAGLDSAGSESFRSCAVGLTPEAGTFGLTEVFAAWACGLRAGGLGAKGFAVPGLAAVAFPPASGFAAFCLAGAGLAGGGKPPAMSEGGVGTPGRSGTGIPTPSLSRIFPPSTRPSGTLMAGSPFLRSVASRALPKLPGVPASARVPTHIASKTRSWSSLRGAWAGTAASLRVELLGATTSRYDLPVGLEAPEKGGASTVAAVSLARARSRRQLTTSLRKGQLPDRVRCPAGRFRRVQFRQESCCEPSRGHTVYL